MEVCCTAHPIASLRPRLWAIGVLPARTLRLIRSSSRVRVCGLLLFLHTPPTRSGKRIMFVTMEDESGLLDLVLFPDAQARCAKTLLTSEVVTAEGILKRKGAGGLSVSVVIRGLLAPLCGSLARVAGALSPAGSGIISHKGPAMNAGDPLRLPAPGSGALTTGPGYHTAHEDSGLWTPWTRPPIRIPRRAMTLDPFAGLNPSQRQAVIHTGGPLQVIAGPGTGKTRVLTCRVWHLLQVRGVQPDRILAVTFTNKAAREILERVERLAGKRREEGAGAPTALPAVNTFHGWALAFLKETLGAAARSPIDEQEARELCREAAREASLGTESPRRIHARISRAKQHSPPTLGDDEELTALHGAYQALLERHGLWDYDDLLLEALRLLAEPAHRGRFREQVPFVLVDEFQDVSPVQYALVRAMASAEAEITVIGDPNQAIYGFRGASPSFLHQFARDFPETATIRLHRVYRCPQTLLDAAGSVIETPVAARLISEKDKGRLLHVLSFPDEESEARWIAGKIEQTVGGLSFDAMNRGAAGGNRLRSLADVCVLFRAHSLGDSVAKALAEHGIPFQRADAPDPLGRPDLRRVWRLWEAARGRLAGYHLERLRRETGAKGETFRELPSSLHGKEGVALLDAILQILAIRPETPWLRVLRQALQQNPRSDSLAVLFDRAVDLLAPQMEAVSLLSIHAAKGIEFPVVFLIACEAGILPWRDADPDEERRLLYVALTRASEVMYLSHAGRRLIRGRNETAAPSPFLEAISKELISMGPETGRKKPKKPRQKTLF